MDAKSLRRRVLLTSTMLVGALTYGGRAYGQGCVNVGGSTFECSDSVLTQQSVIANNAEVIALYGFSVDTGDPRALSITGDGALSYFDEYASSLTAANTALYIRSGADIPAGNQGSVTVDTDGNLTGGSSGIYALNAGSGALSITANGDFVVGTGFFGIFALNGDFIMPAGSALTVTTGPGTAVTGGLRGIYASNFGSGALEVTANGDVEGTVLTGIFAQNGGTGTQAGTAVTVTTGLGTLVTGGTHGIFARNYGSGATSVTANGDVEGMALTGIYAQNGTSIVAAGTDLTVTTGLGTSVTGGTYGIAARNYGSGATSVTANGDVYGTATIGIFALNGNGGAPAGTALTVTTGLGTAVTGGTHGIFALNYGSGATSVTANGYVTGISADGIYAVNEGTSLTITTGAGSDVLGDIRGIFAGNDGSGALTVTANGDVEGTGSRGIFARNGTNLAPAGTDLTVTTGLGTSVTGGSYGIYTLNNGSGALSVTANGDVEGTATIGIFALNGDGGAPAGTALTVTTGLGTAVTGGTHGIFAHNFGSGATSVTANGYVTGISADGIYVVNEGTSLTITTGAGSDVLGDIRGIFARNAGNGALNVTANGDVTGISMNGINAVNEAGTTSLSVRTGAGSYVLGNDYGIFAANAGSGALTVTANGDVRGNLSDGIRAENLAASTGDLSVTTRAGTSVTGGDSGIFAFNSGTGALTVTANGDVTGGTCGISARNYGEGALTLIARGNVTGTNDTGIFARNDAASTGPLSITTEGVTGANFGILAGQYGNAAFSLTTNGDVAGGIDGIRATSTSGQAFTITVRGDVTGGAGDGIYAYNLSGPVTINVEAGGRVTSNGVGAGNFAIDIMEGRGNVTVAGTVNGGGGGGGAISFDQCCGSARLELHPGAVINGLVLTGLPGNNRFVLGGNGAASFDVSSIGPAAQYRGFDTFTKQDGSEWTLTGTNTTIPEFTVNGGELFVNGSLPNTEFMVNGGTLGGTGTVGTTTIGGGGIFAPGNSIGTMTVNGAFTLQAGAVYEVEVNAQGQGDQVIVRGTVNLTGSVLRVLAANGNYNLTTEYLIVDNDGNDRVKGRFAETTTNLAFLTPSVDYKGGDGNDVVLTLLRTVGPGPGPGPISFCSVALTSNQCNVGLALDQFPTTNALFLAVLNQTVEGARMAFDALSGEIHATLSGVLADDSRYVREAILGRLMQANATGGGNTQVASLAAAGPQVASLDASAMTLGTDRSFGSASAPYGQPLAFWTRAYGAWGDFDGDGNAATADRDLGGFVSGMDAQVSGSWRVGLATGASFANVDVSERYSTADVESFLLAGYLGGMAGPLALRGGGAFAWNDIDTSRAVIFPGFFERQNASYDADTGQIFGEVAYPMAMGGMAIEPFAGLAYVSIDGENFREHGGALASLRGSTDQDVGYSTLGLRAATTMHWGSMLVTPHVSAAWQHAFDDVTPGAALAFATTGIGFAIEGVPLAEDTALVDAGLDFALGTNTTAGVSYSGQFGDGVTDNAVKGRVTWLF